ncbi:carboxymuconolactone decarboxylase family protein [Actinokineospora sp. HUAS TT18]|uniref:carboxymuconolactone decarboxylase family protein n=1 Tax=Actinokineospora sp. HUAS TT18 TaxID=3447451 RepID=UPI003F51BA05
MSGLLIRTALRSALNQVQYVMPVRPRRARELVAQVYRRVEREFGMLAPPIALHSPSPDVMAAVWAMLRESLLARAAIDRATREIVAAGVSVGNECPYCVEVHSATLGGLTDGPEAAALAVSRLNDIENAELRALAEWSRDSGAGGRVPSPTAEVMGVAITFHYLNRVVNVFLPSSPLPPNVPESARSRAGRFLGRVMKSSASADHEPGRSLDLLPRAPVGPELWWAEGNPTIAEAFARAYAVIDAAGRRSVPPLVRDLVAAELAAWDGKPKGISRVWVRDAVSVLPEEDRAAGVLALLTAIAAYQVEASVVDEAGLTDAQLVDLTSWASLTAARRVAELAKSPGHAL